MAPVLGYWKIRGVAQSIRLLLEYTGTEFEDRYYECGPAPLFDRSCWLETKDDLDLEFANLPYYIDGDIKITQANAIMRHIARKHDLCGSNETERIRVDMVENQTNDFRNSFIRLCYLDFSMQKHRYLETLPQMLKQLSHFLGSHPWFAGEKVTFVDFIVYELLDQHLALSDICLKDFKNLQEFQKRFEALEPIQRYMSSPRFMKSPINNKMAKFGTN